MIPWILALIRLCAPSDAPKERFNDVATAIDEVAKEEGDNVALVPVLVALAARESRFDPHALGHDEFGHSWGLYQHHETNFPRAGLTPELIVDPLVATITAAWMIEQSRAVCRHHPREEQLGWYASGGPTCDVPEGLEASRNRMRLADQLLRERPPFWSSGRLETSVMPKHQEGR